MMEKAEMGEPLLRCLEAEAGSAVGYKTNLLISPTLSASGASKQPKTQQSCVDHCDEARAD